MTRKRKMALGTIGFGTLALVAFACGGGDDNNAGGDDSSVDSGSGTDVTVPTDSSPPQDSGPADSGPFCNVSPCAVSIGVGGLHSCAVLSDGTVRCWGGNTFGALGSGTVIDGGTVDPSLSATPLAVTGLTNAVGVSGGGYYSADLGYTCAVLANKTLDCWGFNQLGELGRGDASIPADPMPQSTLLTNALEVSANLYGVCAVLSSGDVACWGINVTGQIAQPIDSRFYPAPTLVNAGGARFTHVSTGIYNVCAITDDAHVWCWGYAANGSTGRLTDAGLQDQIPAAVPGIDSAINVAAGFLGACAVKSDNSVVCWGLNSEDMLGRGAQPDAGPPQDPTPLPVAGSMKFKQVVARAIGFCGLATDGTVWCWGDNSFGAGGSGTADAGSATPKQLDVPTQVPGLTDVIQLASESFSFNTCALINGGAVKCWGYNARDQLGFAPADGGDKFSITPVTVAF